MEEDNFKDWIDDAKRNVPIPYLSVPDTPIAEVEIRLVEPTPVPSRVGSLGGSSAAGGLFVAAVVPPKLSEAEEEVNDEDSEGEGAIASSSKVLSRPRARSPRKKGKFFLHSSPSKGSALDSPHPSPVPADDVVIPTMPQPQRRSSGSSSSAVLPKPKEKEKQHVSLSTMQGKFQAEKRRAARAIAEGENSSDASGWENEVEEQDKSDEGWSDEPDSPEKQKRPKRRLSFHSRPGRSASNLDLTNLLTRQTSRHTPPQVPPPPAPTPLRKMSKKQRLAAAAERTQIEAELDAQRKREMFAKQQIFGGQPAGEGLLSRVFKSGGSMVDLVSSRWQANSTLIIIDPSVGKWTNRASTLTNTR